ncbi:Amidase [Handroanthus impetiginosus]|uniref:Amidase n=1 Tax=Handroanthus impetiginosus TaxID=429701 RepID=A0A2G9GIT8_9LAMI|nr:Amidase [Handroanthus impetiginosus]
MCPRTGLLHSTRFSSYQFHVQALLLFFVYGAAASSSQLLSENRIIAPDFVALMDSGRLHSRNDSKCSGKSDDDSLCRGFRMLDADFFSYDKMLEIEKAAKEFNIPTIRSNRKLVASANGGLENPSSLVFSSAWNHDHAEEASKRFNYPSLSGVERPKSDEDIAFMSILELGQLIKSKQITSKELARIFLDRLKRYGPVLESVVTITEELAYEQAKHADELLAQGTYLGPLHGIPYGLKDIIAVPHYKTTWGSKSFKDQVLDIEAWVYKRLKSAGAVLLAKLVTGSLACDDIWFGGRTRNPWNIEEYSTGSSAGSAACTSAGMVPFAIGSETAGSITYPAARCGVTALRPTFGTVGRTGAMSLSESLDKLGPFCRNAEDCAIVLDAIRGKDPDDLSSRNIPLSDPFAVDITKLNVGYLEDAEMDVVQKLQSKGVNMVPFKLNYTVDSAQGILNVTLDVDVLAHFDEWHRSGQDDDYEAQDQWPLELRRARVMPAVDYVQAQRARGKLIRDVRDSFKVDAFVGNVTDWERVCIGNLVGMPVIVVPTGFKKISDAPSDSTRRRTTITTGIYAPPEHDHIALALAMAYQSVTDHHKQRPPIDDLGPGDSIPNPPTKTIPPRQ